MLLELHHSLPAHAACIYLMQTWPPALATVLIASLLSKGHTDLLLAVEGRALQMQWSLWINGRY